MGTQHLVEEGPVVSHRRHDPEVGISTERDVGLQLKAAACSTPAVNARGGGRGSEVVGRSSINLEVRFPKGLDCLLSPSGHVTVRSDEDVLARPGQRTESRFAQGAISRRALVRDLSGHAVAVVMLDGYAWAIRHEIPPH
jgi:hypothetical protein